MASVYHFVAFKLNDASQSAALSDDFFALRHACKNVVSVAGGANNSPEAHLSEGLEVGFVVVFASVADRDYYVHEDPAHQAFIAKWKPSLQKAVVFDFENGMV